MWLLIDDKRDLNCEAIARTSEVAKKLIALGGWDCICFDHDLGEETTGYNILEWMINDLNLYPKRIQLVTSNPVGRNKMALVLDNVGYKTIDKINFYKM